jgi:hypothetical protein
MYFHQTCEAALHGEFSLPMPRTRESNNKKRRIAPTEAYDLAARQALARALTYVGISHHKKHPGDYNFQPPVNPRPTKSICDGLRIILLAEACQLFHDGIMKGMVSAGMEGNVPKYVWSVDAAGEAYEAKIMRGTTNYKGYRLEEEDDMRAVVLREWKNRTA